MKKFKALYIHISKTAGSSIVKAPWVLKHGSPEISPRIPVRDHGLKISFAIVRNPYTRFSSAVLNHGYATPQTFQKWTLTEFKEFHQNRFRSFMRNGWQELMPQHKYLVHEGGVDIGYIGRFENLKEDWKNICDIVEERFELPHLNKNKYPDHEDYMTDMIREVVRDVYYEDFKLLGYDF